MSNNQPLNMSNNQQLSMFNNQLSNICSSLNIFNNNLFNMSNNHFIRLNLKHCQDNSLLQVNQFNSNNLFSNNHSFNNKFSNNKFSNMDKNINSIKDKINKTFNKIELKNEL